MIPIDGGRSLAALVLASFAAGLGACGSPTQTFEKSWTVQGGTFDAAQRAAFSSARGRLNAGDLEGARVELARLAEEAPANLEVRVWLQDVELDIVSSGTATASEALASIIAAESDPVGALRRAYQERAALEPTAENWVLSARLQSEPSQADAHLDEALSLDPQSAWGWYARAFSLIRQEGLRDRWSLARDALDRSLEAEPGFLRARRLRAWMLAEEGQRDAALEAIDAWLVAAEGDPRVDDEARVEARLDRALLLILGGREERAVVELEALEGEPVGRARRLSLLAVAQQERGDIERAIAAAERALAADRGSVLPLVQQALLVERFRDDPDGAEALWREVVARGADARELGDLVQTLRARVRLERREAERADEEEAGR